MEREELGINAGLQDRVIQNYEGLMFMDFSKEHMQAHGFGKYDRLDASQVCSLLLFTACVAHLAW